MGWWEIASLAAAVFFIGPLVVGSAYVMYFAWCLIACLVAELLGLESIHRWMKRRLEAFWGNV